LNGIALGQGFILLIRQGGFRDVSEFHTTAVETHN
jgi:hypothetical protein